LNDHAISATGLRKAYGDHLVLDGVDLHIAAAPSSPCSARESCSSPDAMTVAARMSGGPGALSRKEQSGQPATFFAVAEASAWARVWASR
jgi:hypothetical protein